LTKIRFPKGDVWKDFKLSTKLISPPILNLKLKPSYKRDQIRETLRSVKFTREKIEMGEFTREEIVRSFEGQAKLAFNSVTGWDLEDEKGKITLTDGHKTEYLDPLLWENLEKTEEEKAKDEELKAEKKTPSPDIWLWSAILEFISDMENFSKN